MNNLTAEQLFAVIGEMEFNRRSLMGEVRQRDQIIAEQNAKIAELKAAALVGQNQGAGAASTAAN